MPDGYPPSLAQRLRPLRALGRGALTAGRNLVRLSAEVVAEGYSGDAMALSDLWLLWRPR